MSPTTLLTAMAVQNFGQMFVGKVKESQKESEDCLMETERFLGHHC